MRKTKNKQAILAVTAALLTGLSLTGCEVGPTYVVPTTPLSDQFASPIGATTQPATQAPTLAASVAVEPDNWWTIFNDPELTSLIHRAVATNLDLRIALSRVQQARAGEDATAGGVLPFVDATGAAAKGTGSNNTKGRVGNPLNAGTDNFEAFHEITQVVGFDAGWELDIFGKFRRELEAANADTQAAIENRNAVLVTLLADVARAYFQLRTAQARLALTNDDIVIARKNLDITQQRFNRGITNELDVALAERQLDVELGTIAPFDADIQDAERRLAVLLGQTPESLTAELTAATPLAEPPSSVVTDSPAALLRRRPDIRRAERQLAAETARIGVATADLFPRIAVTAGLGLEGQGLGRSPGIDKFIWSAGPTAYLPLLDFGRIDSLVISQKYRTQEALFTYRRTVLQAIEEVDSAITRYAADEDQLQQLHAARDAGNLAVTVATERYQRGLIDFLNVADAQRQLFEIQDQVVLAKAAAALQFVALYKSLGGGWQQLAAPPKLETPLPAVAAMVKQLAGGGPKTEDDLPK